MVGTGTAQAVTVRAFPTHHPVHVPGETPLGASTTQGQHAHPQPGLTRLHQLTKQPSHLPVTQGNTEFSAGLGASAQTTSPELTSPNDQIDYIIGWQGVKISEIHQMSQEVQIKIVNLMGGSTDRQITIMASPASISLAE